MTAFPKTREALSLLEGAMRFAEDADMFADLSPDVRGELDLAEQVIQAAREIVEWPYPTQRLAVALAALAALEQQ